MADLNLGSSFTETTGTLILVSRVRLKNSLNYAQGSMGMVDPNQKVHEKNHLYRVRNDQGQILAPIFGRSAGAPQ